MDPSIIKSDSGLTILRWSKQQQQHVIPRLHYTTGCQNGLTTGFRFDNRLYRVYKHSIGWTTGCSTSGRFDNRGWTTGCIV